MPIPNNDTPPALPSAPPPVKSRMVQSGQGEIREGLQGAVVTSDMIYRASAQTALVAFDTFCNLSTPNPGDRVVVDQAIDGFLGTVSGRGRLPSHLHEAAVHFTGEADVKHFNNASLQSFLRAVANDLKLFLQPAA